MNSTRIPLFCYYTSLQEALLCTSWFCAAYEFLSPPELQVVSSTDDMAAQTKPQHTAPHSSTAHGALLPAHSAFASYHDDAQLRCNNHYYRVQLHGRAPCQNSHPSLSPHERRYLFRRWQFHRQDQLTTPTMEVYGNCHPRRHLPWTILSPTARASSPAELAKGQGLAVVPGKGQGLACFAPACSFQHQPGNREGHGRVCCFEVRVSRRGGSNILFGRGTTSPFDAH